MNREVRTLIALSFGIITGPVTSSATGTWEISGDGTVFSFQADQADAGDIINGLEAMTGVSLNVKKLPPEPVSVKYINVSLQSIAENDPSETLRAHALAALDAE